MVQEDNYQEKGPEIRRDSIAIIIKLICSSVLGTTYGLTPGSHSGSPITRTRAGYLLGVLVHRISSRSTK